MNQEAAKLHALGDSTGHDGRGGGGKHGLEDEVAPPGVVVVGVGHHAHVFVVHGEPRARGEDAVEVARIHRVKAVEGVTEDANTHDGQILEENVDRVLRLGEAGLHRRETEVHDKHQGRRNEYPKIVHREEREAGRLRERLIARVSGSFFGFGSGFSDGGDRLHRVGSRFLRAHRM